MNNRISTYNYMDRVNDRRYNRLYSNKDMNSSTKKMFLFALIITIMIIVIFSIKVFAFADEVSDKTMDKQFTSIMIYCGDTIDSIAEENYESGNYSSKASFKREIMSINHLTADATLIPGNYIAIPYYK